MSWTLPSRVRWLVVVALGFGLLWLVMMAGSFDGPLAGTPRVLDVLLGLLIVALVTGRALETRAWYWWSLVACGLLWLPVLVTHEPGEPLGTAAASTMVVSSLAGAAGILGICFSGRGLHRLIVVSDAAVVSLAAVLTLWTVGEAAVARVDEVAQATVVLSVDLTLICTVVLVVVRQPWRRSLWLLAGALTASALTRVLIALDAAGAFGWEPSVVVAIGAASSALIIAFVLRPDPDTGAQSTRNVRGPVHLAALVGVLAFVVELARTGSVRGSTAWIAAAFGAAVVANQALTHREERRSVAALAASEQRFRSSFVSAPIGIVIADAAGIVRFANPAVSEMLGWPTDVLVGLPADGFLAADELAARRRLTAELLAGERRRFTQEFWIPHAEGGQRWIRATVSAFDSDEAPDSTIAVLEDVTERHLAQDRLERQRDHDVLTGLLNRNGFMDALEDALEDGPDQVAVVVVDLDLFASINEALGHEAGDRLLLEIGERITAAVGGHGRVARLGGDHFCALLDDGAADDHLAIVNSVAAAIGRAVCLDESGPTHPTASIGVAVSVAGCGAAELLRSADAAVRSAKSLGRNRIEWSVVEAGQLVGDTHRIVNELNVALDEGQLVVEYQPVVAVHSGRTVGAEALVRWDHPERGRLQPGHFLPVAEAAGLIGAIGTVVLETACRDTARWDREIGRLDVSVNVAVAQLSDPSFVGTVLDVLDRTGLDPGRLWLEITESAFMSDVELVAQSLRDLRSHGVHLAIDDFGTGYASLTYLKQFPVESLKVDREFVEGLGVDDSDDAIVAALVDLGRRLGMRVVAEGVELPRQLAMLERAGCSYVQGFLLGRPMAARALEERLLDEGRGRSAQPAAGDPAKASGSPGRG